jgi:hypothetical protein
MSQSNCNSDEEIELLNELIELRYKMDVIITKFGQSDKLQDECSPDRQDGPSPKKNLAPHVKSSAIVNPIPVKKIWSVIRPRLVRAASGRDEYWLSRSRKDEWKRDNKTGGRGRDDRHPQPPKRSTDPRSR